jgi:excisionase family DNA binding protein
MKNKKSPIPSGIRNVILALLRTEGFTVEDLVEKPDHTNEEWVTLKEASRRLGISIDTLRRRIKEGKIMTKKIGPSRNGGIRILWSSVLAWLEMC